VQVGYSSGVSAKSSTPAPAKKPAPQASDDKVLIHGRTDDGKGLKVLRKRNDELSLGEVRPLEEGKAISGEVVSLTPHAEMPLLCDVKVEADVRPANGGSRSGPARVSNPSYRSGWDRMWGKRRKAQVN